MILVEKRRVEQKFKNDIFRVEIKVLNVIFTNRLNGQQDGRRIHEPGNSSVKTILNEKDSKS